MRTLRHSAGWLVRFTLASILTIVLSASIVAAPLTLEALEIPLPILRRLSPDQMQQAYTWGREQRTGSVESVFRPYFVTGEATGAWVLLSTPWAEAALTGWFGAGQERIGAEDLLYLQQTAPFLLTRSPEPYTITLRQGGTVIEPLAESTLRGMAFHFFPLEQLDAQRPLEVDFWADGLRVDEAQWRWTELGEGSRVTPPAHALSPEELPHPEWVGLLSTEQGLVGLFTWSGYEIQLVLEQLTIETSPDTGELVLSLPAQLEGHQLALPLVLQSTSPPDE